MTRIHAAKAILTLAIVAALTATQGCCQMADAYRTPGGGGDMSLMTDQDIRTIWEREPAANLPVHLAIARIQAPHYHSYSGDGYGKGRYSVVTVRDVVTDGDFKRIGDWLQVLVQQSPDLSIEVKLVFVQSKNFV